MRPLLKDVDFFIATSPYIALSKPRGALHVLQHQVEAAEECSAALRAYPAVCIAPLEFSYTCLQSLGALDQDFFEAHLEAGWRGVVWASWLATLDSREQLVAPLQAARPNHPRLDWLIECAVATIEQRTPADHALLVQLAARLRQSLHGVPRPIVRVRAEPNAAQAAQMAREQERIRAAYVSAGADAALRCIRGTLVEDYAWDYARWVRAHARREQQARDAKG